MKQRMLTVRKLPASDVVAHHAFIFTYLSAGRSLSHFPGCGLSNANWANVVFTLGKVGVVKKTLVVLSGGWLADHT